MKLTDKHTTLNIYKPDGDAPVELLRISFKSGGANAYLPHDIIEFLHLDKESRSLVAFLDSEGPYNFIVVTSDKNLSELLKPVVLQKRMKAERLRQKLSVELQAQRQQIGTEVTEAKVME